MIIKTGSTTDQVEQQINEMSRFKRGFNQSAGSMTNDVNAVRPKNPNSMSEAIDLRKKITSMKQGFGKKWN